MTETPSSVDATQTKLAEAGYVCGRDLATAAFLGLKLGRPLLLEGEAGVAQKLRSARRLAGEDKPGAGRVGHGGIVMGAGVLGLGSS